MKLIQDWGESILNDELLFRVMLDDSLSDSERQIFHGLDSTAMKKIYQIYETAKADEIIDFGELKHYLSLKTNIQKRWIDFIISVFQTAFSETGTLCSDEIANKKMK